MKKLILFIMLAVFALTVNAQRSSTSTLVTGGDVYTNLNDEDFSVAPITGGKRAVLTGLSFILEAKNVVSGFTMRIDSATGRASNIPTTKILISGDTITYNSWTGSFNSGDICLVFLKGESRSASSSGGGGAITGVGTYSNASGDFSVEAIDATKKVYVTGVSFTIAVENLTNATATRISSAGAVSAISMKNLAVSGDTITFSNETTNFVSGDSVTLFLVGPTKAYDIAQNADKTIVYNSDYAHYTDIEQIIDETNLNTDSAYAAIYMASYQYFSLHINVSGGVTVTVYATNNSAASDTDETSDWVDYSSTILGAASITDTEGLYIQSTPFMPLKLLVKAVTSDATNAADIFLRKNY